MNIGPIEIDAEAIKTEAMKSVLEIANKHIRSSLNDCWPREHPNRKRIFSVIDEVIVEIINSTEFRSQLSEFCREHFRKLAEEKIENAVARTSVKKLMGEK